MDLWTSSSGATARSIVSFSPCLIFLFILITSLRAFLSFSLCDLMHITSFSVPLEYRVKESRSQPMNPSSHSYDRSFQQNPLSISITLFHCVLSERWVSNFRLAAWKEIKNEFAQAKRFVLPTLSVIWINR